MKRTILIFTLLTSFFLGFADAGMWLPILLKKNEAEMQSLGFKLTAEDVYSVNHSSLKDAVVLFGGGCTAELISKNGLLLTNHHCGYSYIQRYSTLKNNYLHHGFWAKNYQEEIPCEGLTVSFLIKMEDVTQQVLNGTSIDQTLEERQSVIKSNIKTIIAEYTKETLYRADIKPFYYGNQYFIFIYQVYQDVRLVGTPPENIGKFGGDTDNWVWPRHTGDFSLYRIYSGPDGKPAPYSPDNIPMNSPKYLPISIAGTNEGDFTMVLGYPGTTMQYLLSDGVDLVVNYRNPVAIYQRGVRLDIMKKYMNQSTEIRLMYSAKANNIANGWKKWIGENKGIQDSKVILKKQKEEELLQKMIDENSEYSRKYKDVIQNIKDDYTLYKDIELKAAFLRETFPAIELPTFIERFRRSVYQNDQIVEWQGVKDQWIKNGENFYKHYYKPIDQEIFVELLHYYFNHLPVAFIPESLQKYAAISKSELLVLAANWYENSIFASQESFIKFVQNANSKDLKKLKKWFDQNQMFYQANIYLAELNTRRVPELKAQIEEHYRIYLQCLMEISPKSVQFPDANLTMRVAYGKVEGITPVDGMRYLPYTTVKGIIDKENPDVFDYQVDQKLKNLIHTRDFGRYADQNGEMRVAFIASNHTTGGNSGSPILNGKGELVGINFDRMWEGTMSDLYYDLDKCRNISLDIRYVMFIIDKYADAQNIIKELHIKE